MGGRVDIYILQCIKYFNPKERQCQRLFRLPHSCAHFTCLQVNAENKLGFSSTLTENFEMYKLGLYRVRNQIANIRWLMEEAREFWKKHLLH